MDAKTKIVVVFIAVLLAGCAPRIYVEQDSQADLSTLRTFAWIDPEPIKEVESPILDSGLLGKRTRRAVIATLIGFGYQETDVEQADFHATFHVSSQDKFYSRGPRFGFGVHSGGHHTGIGTSVLIGGGAHTSSYEEGSLIIDIIDRASGELVWRGWQNKNVYQDAYSEEAVSQSVKLILDRFAYVEVESGY